MVNKAIKTPCHYQILENTNHQNGSGPIGSDKGGGGMLPFFFNGYETSKPMLSTKSEASLIKPVEVLNLA